MTGEGIERIVKPCGEKAKVRDVIRCSPHICIYHYAQAQFRNGLDVYSLSRLSGRIEKPMGKGYGLIRT